jgi:hypothetical protein|tara:strand:+ start:1644 stop:10343 length:8700 start_codon:yes stop_codon:yes gene_type:complete
MYIYLITDAEGNEEEVTYATKKERDLGISEAEANGSFVELVSISSENNPDGPGDPENVESNIDFEENTSDFTMGPVNVETTTGSQKNGVSNLEDGFSESTELIEEQFKPVFSKTGRIVNKPKPKDDILVSTTNIDELLESPFETLPEEKSKEVEDFVNVIPEVIQRKSESGIANRLIKDYVERDIFQESPLEDIIAMDKGGEVTNMAIEYVQDYFERQPEGTILTSTQIEAIAFNRVNDLKEKEKEKRKLEKNEATNKLAEKGQLQAFENQVLQEKWETMNLKQKELVENQDILSKLLNQEESSDYKKQLAQASAIVEAQKAVDLSRSKLKEGAKANYDANTGAALSMPESIEYETLNIPIADYTEQIDEIKKTLPTLKASLKKEWISNNISKSQLNQQLQTKVTLISKPGRGTGISKEYTFKDLMKLRNGGVDLETLFDVVVSESDNNISQAIDNKMFDSLNDQRRALNLRGEALDQVYLYNIDPGSIKKTNAGLISQFEKTALEATFGDVIGDIIPATQREIFDEIQDVYSDLNIQATNAQKKNFERTFAMQVSEGVGAFVPELAKFALANAITGGILGAAKTMVMTAQGWKAITWANRLNQLKKSKSLFNRAKGLAFDAIVEEIKFKGVTQGESKTGGGVGFALGGAAVRKLIPFRFPGASAALNPVFERVILGGVGGATSSEVALVVEDAYKSVTSDKSFTDLFKNSFIEDAQGNDVKVFERFFVNAAVFAAIGATNLTPKDFRSIKAVERLNDQYNGERMAEDHARKLGQPKLSEVQYNNLLDKQAQTAGVLAVADRAYNNTDLGTLKKEKDEAKEWLNTEVSERSEQYNSAANARAVITKYSRAEANVKAQITSDLEAVKKSNILGNDFKFRFSEKGEMEGDNKGKFFGKSNEIVINLSEFKPGTTQHEINHAITKKILGVNPELTVQLKQVIESTVSKKLKGMEWKLGEQTLEYGEYIDKKHAGKSEAYKAEEYISYLIEMFKNPRYKRRLVDTGVIIDLKNSISTVMEKMGMKPASVADRINLNENNLNRASDVLSFFDSLANGGTKAKNWRSKFNTYNLLAIDAKGLDLVEIVNGQKVESIKKGVEEVMNSSSMKEVTADFKNKNLAEINAEFAKMKTDGTKADAIGVSIGYKFQDIVNKTMESYLIKKGLNNMNSDVKYDIVAEVMYEAIPKSVDAYLAGQRFVDYVKENKLSKEEAAVEFKNRGLRETSGTNRFDRLFGYANGIGKEATITTYILNNLTEKLIGVFQLPKFEGIFKNVSFDAEKIDKLQESGEIAIPESEQGYVDTSSPIQKVQRTRKSAEAILGLSTKTKEKVDKVVDDILKKPVKDLDARAVGTIDTGSGGSYKIAMIPKNQARVTSPDGKAEIMLGARSPIIIIKKIIKKLKSSAFSKLREPGSTDAEKADAQKKFDEYSNLTTNLPKYVKEKILKTELGTNVEKGIYTEMSKDAGELGSEQYQGFVDRSFPLFKTYLSQRAINKRFPEFKEPLVDASGKQIRAKTAAGAPLFLKKNITLAEWRKYFTSKDSPDLQLRRTSLLESLSRELGFDRVMEITIDKGLRERLENDQSAIGNEMESAYVALFQKAVDRGERDGGMASDALIEYSKNNNEKIEETTARWNGLFDKENNLNLDVLERSKPKDYEFFLEILNITDRITTLDFQLANNVMRNMGISDSQIINGIKTNPNKAMSDRSAKEIEELGTAIVTFEKIMAPYLKNASTSINKTVDRVFSNMFGFTRGKATIEKYETILKDNEGKAEDIKLSIPTQKSLEVLLVKLKETSLLGKNAQGEKDSKGDFRTNTFNRNIEEALKEYNIIRARPAKKGITEIENITIKNKELEKYFTTTEAGKNVVKDIEFKDALLNASLLVMGDMKVSASPKQIAKVYDLLDSMLMNNDGIGFRSFSSQRYFSFMAPASRFITVQKRLPGKYDPDTGEKLTAKEQREYTAENKTMALGEFVDVKVREKAKNEHLLAKQKFGVRIMQAFENNELSNPEVVKALTSGYNSLYGTKRYQNLADSNIGAVRFIPINSKIISASTKPTKANLKRIKKMIEQGGYLTKADLRVLSLTYDVITNKSALDQLITDISNNYTNAKFTASFDAFKKNEKFVGKDPAIMSTKQQEVKLETRNSDKMEEVKANSPEIFLPRGLAEMIERRGGAKADQEVSDSKAFNQGKKRYDDKFLPSNSEDFQGLLYKVYGRGKQGDKDMSFMKENILRPYTRAENALSTYRMNLVVDYKALETQMKAMGDNKAEVSSVKRVEKLGFNIDQAVRVYIWGRLGKKIPGISSGEIAQLSGAVHNSPRLQAYAKGIMEITKTAEKYPDPSENWFRSNVQYDLFTYATDGVRSDFLAPWQANVDAMFTKENLNKLESRFGSKYVYNLKQMLERMSKGKSRPESTNESFNTALNYVNGSVATIMFLNMRSAALQTISAANYVNWTDNNPVAIGKVIAENPKLFIKNAIKIWNSDALKDRRTGLRINVEEAEMAKAINAGGRTNLQGLWDTMVKVGFKPTQMADSFAIVTGGTPFYMNRVKTYEKEMSKSKAEARAWEDFLDVTQESQQSSQMDRVSNIQTGLMGRLIFSFNNTPFQMSRLQKKAALDLVNNRGDMKTNASKLGYYAFVQSTLFYGLQQGFYSSFMSDEDDNLSEKEKEAKYKDFEKRLDRIGTSTFQGILTGSGLPGKIAVTAYNTVRQGIKQYDKGYAGKDFFPVLNKALSISPTLGSKVSRMGRNWNSLFYSDFTKRGKEIKNLYGPFDPQNPNNKAYLSMLGTATNIPLDRIIQKMENIQGVLNENNENWERVAMFFGAPKWSLQNSEENRADMDKRINDFYEKNTSEETKIYDELKSLKKDEQIKILNGFDNISANDVRALKSEADRIEAIIRLRKEQKKKNSLK